MTESTSIFIHGVYVSYRLGEPCLWNKYLEKKIVN